MTPWGVLRRRLMLSLCAGLVLSGCGLSSDAAPGAPLGGRPPASPPKSTPLQTAAAAASGGLSQGEPGGQPPAAPTHTLAPPAVTVVPQSAPSASPSPPARQPVLRQLTQSGCCAQPFWSPDSQQVLYIDRPGQDSLAGIWGAPVTGGPPALWSERLGLYSPNLSLRAYPARNQTIIERLADGRTWTVANAGRAISFSPDGTRVAWMSGQSGPPFDSAVRQIWISPIEGGPARQALAGEGMGLAGWLSDGRLLVTTRAAAPQNDQIVSILTLPGDPGQPPTLQEVARGERLRSLALSPGGDWLAYVVSFTDDPADSGLWLASLATGQRRKVEPFGAYRWRDANHLLLVPLEPGAPSNRLVQIEAGNGAAAVLLDPQQPPFKIANGDWSVSPDGRYVVFVAAQDQALWLIELP